MRRGDVTVCGVVVLLCVALWCYGVGVVVLRCVS